MEVYGWLGPNHRLGFKMNEREHQHSKVRLDWGRSGEFDGCEARPVLSVKSQELSFLGTGNMFGIVSSIVADTKWVTQVRKRSTKVRTDG